MIGPDTRFRQKEGLLSQRAADTRVLLDPADGNYFALDEVSGRIWDLCDGDRTVAQVVEARATRATTNFEKRRAAEDAD